MDNQKSNEGKGIDANKAGSNIGKSQDSSLNKGTTASSGSQQSASSNLGSTSSSPSSPSQQNASSSGNMGSTGPSSSGSSIGSSSSSSSNLSSAAGSSGSLGNSGLGASSSSQSSILPSPSTPASSSSSTAASSDSSNGDQSTVGGIKAAISSISPDKVHAGIDKAAQAAQPVVDNLASRAHAGVDKVTGLLSSAQEKFGGGSAQLSEKCSDLSAQGKDYVKNNPGSALLAAVGVGFILAKLLGGSSDRHEYRNYRDYRD